MSPGAHTTSLPARENTVGRGGVEGGLSGDHGGVTGFPYRITPTLPTNHKNQSKINRKKHWEIATYFGNTLLGWTLVRRCFCLEQGPISPSDVYTLCF